MTSNNLTINAEDLLVYLRKLGFGLGCWFYSNEELEQPETKDEIKTSIIHLLELDDDEARRLAELLIRTSLSFSDNTVDRVKKETKPHSLSQFIEGATENKLLCYTNDSEHG
ncbi:hypothetical protein [Aliivibrio fischeri]|uniref:hypothetical protein n=1 Tax=Aliivibrio fischeri TaxID=668 RepID=UPI0012D8E577|nr:hypothetical protein [Aliivibrio fischeri]MUJ20429.1 hypothetical protein [Aliivibrio fischeri]